MEEIFRHSEHGFEVLSDRMVDSAMALWRSGGILDLFDDIYTVFPAEIITYVMIWAQFSIFPNTPQPRMR